MDDSNKDSNARPSYGREKSINISRKLSVHSDHSELVERINVIDDDGVPRTITRNVFIPAQVETKPQRRRTLSERQGEAERRAYQTYLRETGGGSPKRPTDPVAGGDERQRRRHSIAEVRAREQQERESRAMRESQREISMVQEADKAGECFNQTGAKGFQRRPDQVLQAEREWAESVIEDPEELAEHLEFLNHEYTANVIDELDNIRAKAEEKYQNERQMLMQDIDDPEDLQEALEFLDTEYQFKLEEIDEYAKALDWSPSRPQKEAPKPKKLKRSVSIAAIEPVAGPSRPREPSPSTVTLARKGSMVSSRSTVRDLDSTRKRGRKTPSRRLDVTKRSQIPRTASQKYLPGTDIIGQKARLKKAYKDEVERTMREVEDGSQQTQLLKSLKKALKRRFARLENREREERRLKKKYIAELDEARANLTDPVILGRKERRLKDEFLSKMEELAKETGGIERDRRLLDEREIRGEFAREGKTPAKTPARTPRVPSRSARLAATPTPSASRVLETRRQAAAAARSKSRASASSRRPSAAPSRSSVVSARSVPPVTPAASRVLDAKRKAATAARTAVRAAPRTSRRAETTDRTPRSRSTTSQPKTLADRRKEARKQAAAASRATASERRASAAPSRTSVNAARSASARQPAESRVQAARRAAAAATRTATRSRRPPSGAPSRSSVRSVPVVTPSASRIQQARKAAAAASRSTARTARRPSAAASRTSVRSVPVTTPAASRIQDSRRAAAEASRTAARSARRPATGVQSRPSLASARSAPARTPAASRMQEARRAAAAASRSAAAQSTHRRPQAASAAASRASMLSGRGAPTPSASRVQQARQAAAQAGRTTAKRPATSRSRASVAPVRSTPSVAPSASRMQEARRKAAEASRQKVRTAPRPRRAASSASARAAPPVSRMEDARRRAASASRSKAALARSTGRRRRLDPERERFLQMQAEQAPGFRKASEKYLAGTDLVKLRAKAKQEYQRAVKRAKDTIQDEAELADRLQDLEENYQEKLKKINSFDVNKVKLKMKYLEDLKRLRSANADEEEITDLRENLKDDLEALDREVGADVRLEPITDREIERDVQRFKILAQKRKEARTPKPPKTVARKASEKYVGATDLVKLRATAKQDYAKSVQDAKNLIRDENELKNRLKMLRDEYAKKLKHIDNLNANKIKLKAKYLEDLKRAKEAGADQDALNDIQNELQDKLERLEREAGVPQRRLTPINERDIRRELDRHKTLAETLKAARTPKPQPKKPPGTAKARQALLAPSASRPVTSRSRRRPRKTIAPPTTKPEPKATQASVNILKKKAKEEFGRQLQAARAEIADEVEYARKVEALKAELASKLHFIRNMDKYKGTVYQKYQKDIRNAMETTEDKDILKERLDYLKDRYTMRIDHINEMAGMPRRPLARSPDAEIRDQVNKTIRNLGAATSRRASEAAVGTRDPALGASQRPVTPAGRPTRKMRPRRLSSVRQFSPDDPPQRTAKRPPAKKMILKKGELNPRLQKFLEEQRGPPKPKALPASERYPLVAQLNYLKGLAKQNYKKDVESAQKHVRPDELEEHLEFLKYEYKAQVEFINDLPNLKKEEEDKYDIRCSQIRAEFADSAELNDHLRLAKEEYKASIARLMKAALGKHNAGKTKFDDLTNRLMAHPTRAVRELPEFAVGPPKLSAVFHPPSEPIAGPSGLQRTIAPALMAKKTTTPVKSLAKPRSTAKKPEATPKRPPPKIKTKSARDANMALEKSTVEPKTSEWRVPASARHLIRQKKAIEEGIAQLRKKTKNNKELLQRLDQTEPVEVPISEASLRPLARDIGLGTSPQEVRKAMKLAKQLGAVAKRKVPPTAAKAAQKKDPIGVSPLEAEEADNIFKMMMDETEGVDLKKDPKEVVKLKVPSDAPKLAVIGNAVESLSRGVITNKIPVKEINVLSAKTAEDFASVVRQQPKSRFPNQSIAAKRIKPTKEKPADATEEGAEEPSSEASALKPSTKLHSDFLECELTLNSFQVETFFQARGSMLPKWFPGIYTVYPEDSPKLVMKKSPSEVLHRAWETMKPKFKADRRPTP